MSLIIYSMTFMSTSCFYTISRQIIVIHHKGEKSAEKTADSNTRFKAGLKVADVVTTKENFTPDWPASKDKAETFIKEEK